MKKCHEMIEKTIIEKSAVERELKDRELELKEIEQVQKDLELELQHKGKQLEQANHNKEETNRKRENIDEEKRRHTKDYKKKTCIQFVKWGKCRYGDQCKFEHMGLCNSLSSGRYCKYNQDCRYSHDKSVICRWSQEGNCRFGERCKYVHIRNSTSNIPPRIPPTQEREAGGRNYNTVPNTRRKIEGIREYERRPIGEQEKQKSDMKEWREMMAQMMKVQIKEEMEKIKTELRQTKEDHFLYEPQQWTYHPGPNYAQVY